MITDKLINKLSSIRDTVELGNLVNIDDFVEGSIDSLYQEFNESIIEIALENDFLLGKTKHEIFKQNTGAISDRALKEIFYMRCNSFIYQ